MASTTTPNPPAGDPLSIPLPHLGALPLLSTTSFSHPASVSSTRPAAAGPLLACNPAIDLTATAAEGGGGGLHVWRAGDQQLVAKHVERGGRKVEGVRWKEDGQFLAAGWSDGVVRLVGLESSKAVHHIRVCDAQSSSGGASGKINFIAWSRNVAGERARRKRRKLERVQQGSDDLRLLLDGDRTGDVAADLPHELTFLEVETALPKLSPLPVSGGSGDDMFLFSTAASLDFVFSPCKAEDADDVHVMVVGTTDGAIHLSIYDSFVIGTLRHSPRGDGVYQLCGHSTHPETSTHMLMLRPQAGDGTALYLVPMNLTFLHHSPVNLSLLASKTTTLQNLLRYLKQTQSHMVSEWKSTRELPNRFMLGVQDDLKKMGSGELTVVQALYHTVVTGHVFPPVKEWLVDSLAERGHKRWEKAVVSGLTSLRSLVHENFIPALERCGVILSRLLGIARFQDSEENIGFDEAQIKKLTDLVSCLMLVAHRVLTTVMDELEHFTAFSVWLRFEIDKQASSSANEELSEKEATMDNVKVLTYIQHYLSSSPLALYFDEVGKEDYLKDQEMIGPSPSLLELLGKQLQEQEAGRPYMKVLPRVDFLVNYLTSRASAVFKSIAEAERQSIQFGQATEVSIGQKIWKHDLWMSRRSKKDDSNTTFTAVVPEEDRTKIYIIRSDVSKTEATSRHITTSACGLGLPEGLAIIDFKFFDDKTLLVLCSRTGEPQALLVRIAYRSARLPYQEYTPGTCPSLLALDQDIGSYSTLPHASGFTPIHMEIQKASTLRGKMPARVCLLGRDRAMFKSYALPEDWGAGSQQ